MSTSRTRSQRSSSCPMLPLESAKLTRSFSKLSTALASSLRPADCALAEEPAAFATASFTSVWRLAASFSLATSLTCCRRSATMSTTSIQVSLGSRVTRKPSTPSIDMVDSISWAAFNTGSRESVGESIVALASSTNFEMASTTLGVPKLSRIAL
eukprot:Skav202541  [mRNA]  locus=scaffold2011:253969:256764:+ [translate_table: standard]